EAAAADRAAWQAGGAGASTGAGAGYRSRGGRGPGRALGEPRGGGAEPDVRAVAAAVPPGEPRHGTPRVSRVSACVPDARAGARCAVLRGRDVRGGERGFRGRGVSAGREDLYQLVAGALGAVQAGAARRAAGRQGGRPYLLWSGHLELPPLRRGQSRARQAATPGALARRGRREPCLTLPRAGPRCRSSTTSRSCAGAFCIACSPSWSARSWAG